MAGSQFNIQREVERTFRRNALLETVCQLAIRLGFPACVSIRTRSRIKVERLVFGGGFKRACVGPVLRAMISSKTFCQVCARGHERGSLGGDRRGPGSNSWWRAVCPLRPFAMSRKAICLGLSLVLRLVKVLVAVVKSRSKRSCGEGAIDGNAVSCSCVVHPITLAKIPAVRSNSGESSEYWETILEQSKSVSQTVSHWLSGTLISLTARAS